MAEIDRSLGVPIARVPDFKYAISDGEEPREFRDLEVGVERHLRLHLRTLLNQSNGSFPTTNAIADDLALVLLRDFDIKEKNDGKD